MSSSFLIVATGGYVIALDRKTGEQMWQYTLPSSLQSRGQTVVCESTVYVAVQSGQLVLLDYKTGKELRKASFEGSGQAPAVLLDADQIFVVAGGEVTAFDLKGEMLWHEPLKGKGNGVASLAFPGNDRQGDEY